MVDLGEPFLLSDLVVEWRRLAFAKDYSLFGSLDKASWRPLAEHVDAEAGEFIRSERGDPVLRMVTKVASADPVRYIKLLVPKGSAYVVKHPDRWDFVEVMELRAYPALDNKGNILRPGK